MPALTPEETEALARLARLSLDGDERETFAGQLARILTYIDALERVSLDGVDEYRHARAESVTLRDDVAGLALDARRMVAGAPEVLEGQVVVPKFKED